MGKDADFLEPTCPDLLELLIKEWFNCFCDLVFVPPGDDFGVELVGLCLSDIGL